MDTTTFTVTCPYCGNPVAVTVEKNTSGGATACCYKCSHMLVVDYSYTDYGLRIYGAR